MFPHTTKLGLIIQINLKSRSKAVITNLILMRILISSLQLRKISIYIYLKVHKCKLLIKANNQNNRWVSGDPTDPNFGGESGFSNFRSISAEIIPSRTLMIIHLTLWGKSQQIDRALPQYRFNLNKWITYHVRKGINLALFWIKDSAKVPILISWSWLTDMIVEAVKALRNH